MLKNSTISTILQKIKRGQRKETNNKFSPTSNATKFENRLGRKNQYKEKTSMKTLVYCSLHIYILEFTF